MPSVPPVPATPYLAVDIEVLERNLAAMAQSARDRRLNLRPHAKTHKCPEIASRQIDLGATGLTVATLSEAEVFADAGFTDIFIAYPLWVEVARGERLRSLSERCSLVVGIDSAQGAESLARHSAGARAFGVLIEIDCGHHRTGVVPDAAGELAVAAATAGLEVRGVFSFPGHSYGPGRASAAAVDEALALALATESLRVAGFSSEVVSGGSTPSAALTDAEVITEMRPGVYVFNDAQQLEMGTCAATDIALTAIATVVSRSRGQVVLDSGSKVLGADRPPWSAGFGVLADYPDARLSALSEHHGTVQWPEGSAPPELGTVLRVVPNHACAAVNLADELVVVAGDSVIDRWRVSARGKNN